MTIMGIKGSYHVRACWNLRWKGVSVEAEVANPEFGAEIDLKHTKVEIVFDLIADGSPDTSG